MRAIDLTGKRFGRLTVLRLNPVPYRSPSGKPTRRWDCRCDCGREVTVLQNQLTGGTTQSCGCLQKEKAGEAATDLTGKRFGRLTVIRRELLPKPDKGGSKHGWLCRCDCGKDVIVVARSLTEGKTISCGCVRTEKAVERINSDNVLGRYDGTVVSAIKERPANKNSKSGVRGVYWSDREQRWIAKIGLRGRTITIGRYRTIEEATLARAEAEEQYYKPIIDEYESPRC